MFSPCMACRSFAIITMFKKTKNQIQAPMMTTKNNENQVSDRNSKVAMHRIRKDVADNVRYQFQASCPLPVHWLHFPCCSRRCCRHCCDQLRLLLLLLLLLFWLLWLWWLLLLSFSFSLICLHVFLLFLLLLLACMLLLTIFSLLLVLRLLLFFFLVSYLSPAS